MGANKQDNGSTPAEVVQDGNATDDQTGGTSIESQSTEQPTDQDSGVFSGIDRATLTPEMQQMYDSMNGDYTKSKQALAEQGRVLESRRDFAAIGELVEQNPAINKMVWDAIGQIRSGQQVGVQQEVVQQGAVVVQPQDDVSPEEQAARSMISEEVMKVVNPLVEQIQGIMGPVGRMTDYMSHNQAATEYQLLCQKYPAAATVRPQELQTIQLKYTKVGGGSISIEEAFVLMAGTNPALLTAKPNESPSGNTLPSAGNTVVTGVERGSVGTVVNTGFAPGTKGFQALKAAAKKLAEDGAGGISNAMNRARTKFDQTRPNRM